MNKNPNGISGEYGDDKCPLGDGLALCAVFSPYMQVYELLGE